MQVGYMSIVGKKSKLWVPERGFSKWDVSTRYYRVYLQLE